MSKSDDVKALFRRFGGNASSYREIVSDDQVGQAEEKWPMLRQIDPTSHEEAPSVRRMASLDHGTRQPQLAPAQPPVMAAPIERIASESRGDVPAQRMFSRAAPDPRPAPSHSQSPISAPRAAVPPAAASGPKVGLKGSFLSGRPTPSSPQPQEAAPSPAAQPRMGWLGRRVAPVAPVVPAASPVAPKAQPLESSMASPARMVAAQSGKPGGRRKPAGAALGQAKGAAHNGAQHLSAAPAQPSGSGLKRMFSSKLAQDASPVAADERGDGQADGGGLGGLFQRIAAPPAAEARPTAALSAGRKRAVKW